MHPPDDSDRQVHNMPRYIPVIVALMRNSVQDAGNHRRDISHEDATTAEGEYSI